MVGYETVSVQLIATVALLFSYVVRFVVSVLHCATCLCCSPNAVRLTRSTRMRRDETRDGLRVARMGHGT